MVGRARAVEDELNPTAGVGEARYNFFLIVTGRTCEPWG